MSTIGLMWHAINALCFASHCKSSLKSRGLFRIDLTAAFLACMFAWNGRVVYAEIKEESPDDVRVASIIRRLNQLPGEEGLIECERLLQQPEPSPGFHRYIRIHKVYLLSAQDSQAGLDAIHRYIQVASTTEDRCEFRMLLVAHLEESGLYESAISEQRTLIAESESSVKRDAMLGLARLQLYGPNPSDALDTWDRIESVDRAAGRQISPSVVFGRVQSLLALNRPQDALSEFNRFAPPEPYGSVNYWFDWVQLHNLKARAHNQLGQPELAEQERELARGALREMRKSDSRSGQQFQLSQMPPMWIWAIPIPIIWLIYITAAWKQRKHERGTWGSLILVTGAMACLCMLPLAAFVIRNIRETVPDNQQFFNAFVGSLITFGYTFFFFKSLFFTTPDQKTQPYPEVTDPDVLLVVESLSTRFGIRTPSVRRFPPIIYAGSLYAQVSGLVAPTVTINSDVLHRLTVEERNSLLAHELAHLRNHSLGIYACLTPISMALGVSLLPDSNVATNFIWSWLCWTGLWKLVSRRLEYDCDRRAAELCGPEQEAFSLVKFHTSPAFQDEGLIARLFYATQTHPSLEQRLAALAERFPTVTWNEGMWSAERRAAQTRTNWLVGLTWFTLLVALATVPAGWGSTLTLALCFSAILAPMILWRLAEHPEVRRHLKRSQGPGTNWWKNVAVWTLALAVVATLSRILHPRFARFTVFRQDPLFFSYLISIGLIVIVGYIWRIPRVKSQGVSQRIIAALMLRDWPQVLAIAESEQQTVSRNFDCSYNTALARWLNGDHEQAICEMEAVSERFPDRAIPLLVLWDMSMERENWDEAIRISDRYLSRFPDDPVGISIKIGCLARCGRTDEARQLLQSCLWTEEERFNKLAIEARLAMHERDWALARERMKQADEIIPGALRLRLLGAELDMECGDLDRAGKTLDQAERQMADSPFDLVSQRMGRLRTRWREAVISRNCNET